jgi:hypothetical protein
VLELRGVLVKGITGFSPRIQCFVVQDFWTLILDVYLVSPEVGNPLFHLQILVFISLTYTYVYSHKISSLHLPLAESPLLPMALGTTASYSLCHPTYLSIVVFSQRPFLDNTSGGYHPTDPAWPSQVISAISLLTTTAYLRCVDPLHGRPGGTFLTSKHYLI